jgi:hypothetical protein
MNDDDDRRVMRMSTTMKKTSSARLRSGLRSRLKKRKRDLEASWTYHQMNLQCT